MITAGEIKAAVSVIAGINATALRGVVASHFGDLGDDAEIVEDGLALLVAFFPPAAPVATLATVLLALAPLVEAQLMPDPEPEVDAETKADPHTGRNF